MVTIETVNNTGRGSFVTVSIFPEKNIRGYCSRHIVPAIGHHFLTHKRGSPTGQALELVSTSTILPFYYGQCYAISVGILHK